MRPLHKDDPRQIGGHRLVAVLGEGATAQVFLGATPEGRPVVLKAVRPVPARDAGFRARFAREVAAARSIDNPYAVPVVDAEVGGPVLWLATEYAPGPALAEAVHKCGPLPPHSVRTLAAGLAAALDALHAVDLTHGRLGPAHVALAPDGPRVVDLGVARSPDGPSVSKAGVVIGTVLPAPAYRSPEQLDGRVAGPASDVFSLGSVLVFAATGAGPFGEDNTPGIGDRVGRAAPTLDGLPSWLGELVSACLAKDRRTGPRQRRSTRPPRARRTAPAGCRANWPAKSHTARRRCGRMRGRVRRGPAAGGRLRTRTRRRGMPGLGPGFRGRVGRGRMFRMPIRGGQGTRHLPG